MEAKVRIDGQDALTIRPEDPGWGQGKGIVVHAAAAKLSCRLDERSTGLEVMPWLEHLLAENGHRERCKARARARWGKHGGTPGVINVGHELWGNADSEYAGKVKIVALDRHGQEVDHQGAEDGYVPIDDEHVGWLVGAAGRMAEGGKEIEELKERLREHGLSGGRGKVCLRWDWDEKRWLMPVGRALSSHILKNESSREWLPAEAGVEAYCQQALGLGGVEACWTRARRYAGIATVVSWRSDRGQERTNGPLQPIHQEEWSQAVGLYPEEKKVEGQEGQDWPGLIRILGQYGLDPEKEQHKVVKVMAAVVLMGNGDTHRRNVGVQHVLGREGEKIVLAPLYDSSSVEGVAWAPTKRMELAIGGETEFDRVGAEQWGRVAEAAGVSRELVFDAVRAVAEELPGGMQKAAEGFEKTNEVENEGALRHRVESVQEAVEERAERTLKQMRTRAQHRTLQQKGEEARRRARLMPPTPKAIER